MKRRREDKTLHFEPTIFRDWSIPYCELTYISATHMFKKQFGWAYSDIIFLWDGKKEIIYRAREEHYYGMFKFIEKNIYQKRDFIKKISHSLLKEITEYKKLLNKWLKLKLNQLNNHQLLEIFYKLRNKYLPLLPRFLIIMYFPQQIEKCYPEKKKKFIKELKICLTTRPQVDKILAPLTEKFLRKFEKYVLTSNVKLKIKNIEKYAPFLSIKEIRSLLSESYSQSQQTRLISQLKKEKDIS